MGSAWATFVANRLNRNQSHISLTVFNLGAFAMDINRTDRL